MRSKFALLTLTVVLSFAGITAFATNAVAQGDRTMQTRTDRNRNRTTRYRHATRYNNDRDRDRRTSRSRRYRDTHGYRNYGQYRRTQVGNRRFRNGNSTTSNRRVYSRTHHRRTDNDNRQH